MSSSSVTNDAIYTPSPAGAPGAVVANSQREATDVTHRRSRLTFLLCLAIVALSSCELTVQPALVVYPVSEEFGLANASTIAEPQTTLSTADFPEVWKAQIQAALQMYFGSPEVPFVLGNGEEFPTATLRTGRDLFRAHCIHCHGLYGDGDGPTAPFLNPRPRDFRNGKFKFKSTPVGKKPTREDIVRVIQRGAHGTMMPSFDLPWEVDLEALAAYVQLLAMRGELEGFLIMYCHEELDLDEPDEGMDPDDVSENFEIIQSFWADAEDAVIEVGETGTLTGKALEGSIARGKKLYANKAKGNCLSCHGAKGDGEGPDKDKYTDAWGFQLKPRNLTLGLFRGGARPVDIYLRIAAGIDASPMPGYAGTMTSDEIWDVVRFVRSLRYAQASEDAEEKGSH